MSEDKGVTPIDERVVFMLAKDNAGCPVLTLGIPKKCYENMLAGKTSNFDLTRAGLELKILVTAGESHDAIMKDITDGAAKAGITIRDERRADFAIKTGNDNG